MNFSRYFRTGRSQPISKQPFLPKHKSARTGLYKTRRMYNLLSLVLLRLDEPSYYSLAPSIGRTSSTTTYRSDGSHKEKNPLFAAKPRFRELWGKEKKEKEEEERREGGREEEEERRRKIEYSTAKGTAITKLN